MKTCTKRWGTAALLAFLLGDGGSEDAEALAAYRTFGDVTLEISGTPLDVGLLRVAETYSVIHDVGNDPAFPSFVTPESDVTFGPDERSVRVRVASTGAANNAGGAEAFAEGASFSAAVFRIVNPTDLGFFLDVSIRGSFEYSAFVDDGYQELAGTRFMIAHYGSLLEGLHDPIFILDESTHVRPPLMPVGGPHAFDRATTTFLLGADESYSLLIPPTFVVTESDDEIVIEITIHEVGIQVQAAGHALSILGGATSLVVDEGPPGPDPVDPAEIPPPPFENRPPVPACLEPVGEWTRPDGKTMRLAPGQDVYRLWADDDIDPAPRIYLTDPYGAGPYGPFAPGDLVRIQQRSGHAKGSPQGQGPRKGAPWGFVENVFLSDVAIVTAVDRAGKSATIKCPLPPRRPKDGQGVPPTPSDGPR